MKINKKNPEHLAALAISGLLTMVAITARPFIKRRGIHKEKIVIFYGHTFHGNLKAFSDYLHKKRGYKPYFLVLDRNYLKQLRARQNDKDILSAFSLRDMLQVAKADAFITSHGMHFFSLFRTLTNIKFIDVWHAVSHKGFSSDNFRGLWGHDQIWVSSEDMKEMYINRYKFAPDKVRVTGYGRTDQLVNGSLDKKKILTKYKIPKFKKYILIAPTWHQDEKGRSLVPYGLSEKKFFSELDKIAVEHSAGIIFRTHLNSGDAVNVDGLKNILFMPYSKYEIVEDFLFIADICVTDWSSVNIDYLPLKRPALFLDVPAPFKHGFNLGPEHRYGDVAKSFTEFKRLLRLYLTSPDEFTKRHSEDMKSTSTIAYGDSLDGKSCDRYFANLKELLED